MADNRRTHVIETVHGKFFAHPANDGIYGRGWDVRRPNGAPIRFRKTLPEVREAVRAYGRIGEWAHLKEYTIKPRMGRG